MKHCMMFSSNVVGHLIQKPDFRVFKIGTPLTNQRKSPARHRLRGFHNQSVAAFASSIRAHRSSVALYVLYGARIRWSSTFSVDPRFFNASLLDLRDDQSARQSAFSVVLIASQHAWPEVAGLPVTLRV